VDERKPLDTGGSAGAGTTQVGDVLATALQLAAEASTPRILLATSWAHGASCDSCGEG
jgi:hypothetical protein